MFNSLAEYIKETKGELKHVSWPTKKQTINFTVSVIAVSIAVSLFLAFFDKVFIFGLDKFFLN